MKEILITGVIILLCLAGIVFYNHFTYVETQDDANAAFMRGDKETGKKIMQKIMKTSPHGQFFRGYYLFTGKGPRGEIVPVNKEEGLDLIKKSAEKGFDLAQRTLGNLYFEGSGIPQDFAEAYFWLNIAASQNEQFVKERDIAASNLSVSKREEVQEKCKEWMEKFKLQNKGNDNKPIIWQDVKVYEWGTWWAGFTGIVFIMVGGAGLILKKNR